MQIHTPVDNELDRIWDNKQLKYPACREYNILCREAASVQSLKWQHFRMLSRNQDYLPFPSPSHIVLEGFLKAICGEKKYYTVLILRCLVPMTNRIFTFFRKGIALCKVKQTDIKKMHWDLQNAEHNKIKSSI